MAKKRNKRHKKGGNLAETPFDLPSFSWMAEDGLHLAVHGSPPLPEQLSRMTEEYRKRIRNSPIWDEMVREFGEEEAEELLKEFRIDIR